MQYLNMVLTVLCVLLAAQLWTSWSGGAGAGMAQPAIAQAAPNSTGGGIPDAGAQRKEMIDLLKRISQQTDELNQLLRSGGVRVKVESVAREGK